jgi:hypothetical protein
VSFAAITVCVASQRLLIIVISLSTQSGNFWIYPQCSNRQRKRESKNEGMKEGRKGRKEIKTYIRKITVTTAYTGYSQSFLASLSPSARRLQ